MGKKKKNSSPPKPAASPKKSDPPVTEPEAAAGEMEHASGSVLDRMYRPLPAKVIWMLPHSSRCHLVAVDHQRCSWACESGALRRVFLYNTQQSLQLKIDWYTQHGLEQVGLQFADDFNEPVENLPASLTQITFGWDFNQPVEQLPASVMHLTFGRKFNQSVEQLPSSIAELSFHRGYQQPVDCLPANVKTTYHNNS